MCFAPFGILGAIFFQKAWVVPIIAVLDAYPMLVLDSGGALIENEPDALGFICYNLKLL